MSGYSEAVYINSRLAFFFQACLCFVVFFLGSVDRHVSKYELPPTPLSGAPLGLKAQAFFKAVYRGVRRGSFRVQPSRAFCRAEIYACNDSDCTKWSCTFITRRNTIQSSRLCNLGRLCLDVVGT